jgi:hypothetical protein
MYCDNFAQIDSPAADFQVSEYCLVVEVNEIKKELITIRPVSYAHVRLAGGCCCLHFVYVFPSACPSFSCPFLFILFLRFHVRLSAFLLRRFLAGFEAFLSEGPRLFCVFLPLLFGWH